MAENVPMVALFSDFGGQGPYAGQVEAVVAQAIPNVRFINLFLDAPAFNPKSSAYLLSAYAQGFPRGTLFLCVVDPGVGGDRGAVAVYANEKWFIGPDNGLLQMVSRASNRQIWSIDLDFYPEKSNSFHGRDVFAPLATKILSGDTPRELVNCASLSVGNEWSNNLEEVIYVDHYGNLMTGIDANTVSDDITICLDEHKISYQKTFSRVSVGTAFWYRNSNGLVEIAANCARAENVLGAQIGSKVKTR